MKKLFILCLLLITAVQAQLANQILRNGLREEFKYMATVEPDTTYSFIHTSKPFILAVMQGKVPGHSTIDKFGFNGTIATGTTPETVWLNGGVYPRDTIGTAPIVSIASTSAADTLIPIQVEGLDIDGYKVVYTDTLDGTNRVALSTPLYRNYRLQNVGAQGQDLDGTVFTYTGTGAVPTLGDANVRAVIDDGDNQTLQTFYTVPRGHVGHLFRGEIGIEWTGGAFSGVEYARFRYRSCRYGKVCTNKKIKTLMTSGSSHYEDVRPFPDVIPALTDIDIQVYEVSATMGADAALDIMLVEEWNYTPGFLISIGQPGFSG